MCACIDHVCTNPACGWARMDNEAGPGACPKCGERVAHHFDEAEWTGREEDLTTEEQEEEEG